MTGYQYREKEEEVKLHEVKAGEAPPVEIKVADPEQSATAVARTTSTEENSKSALPPVEPGGETPPSLGPRYDILGLVGTGGMGTVWKVHDKELDEDFAIKVLKPELVTDETALKRFQKEANLASELTHANIAAIFGPGEDGAGRPYIIMRYVDGESLADILKREGKLSEERAMDIFSQLCEALSHSHMKGIIHRDIKPSNIIISKTESGADLVQLVDFGIARCVYDEVTKTQALTKAVDVFGSPRYMSPEQLLGEEVTETSDIYSLGVVLYEMLAGEPPFSDENPVKLIMQQLTEEADLDKIPPSVSRLVRTCLNKNAHARAKDMRELTHLLNENLATPLVDDPGEPTLAGYLSIILILPSLLSLVSGFNVLTAFFYIALFAIGLILSNSNTQVKNPLPRILRVESTLLVSGALALLNLGISGLMLKFAPSELYGYAFFAVTILSCIAATLAFFLITKSHPITLSGLIRKREIKTRSISRSNIIARKYLGKTAGSLLLLFSLTLFGLLASNTLILAISAFHAGLEHQHWLHIVLTRNIPCLFMALLLTTLSKELTNSLHHKRQKLRAWAQDSLKLALNASLVTLLANLAIMAALLPLGVANTIYLPWTSYSNIPEQQLHSYVSKLDNSYFAENEKFRYLTNDGSRPQVNETATLLELSLANKVLFEHAHTPLLLAEAHAKLAAPFQIQSGRTQQPNGLSILKYYPSKEVPKSQQTKHFDEALNILEFDVLKQRKTQLESLGLLYYNILNEREPEYSVVNLFWQLLATSENLKDAERTAKLIKIIKQFKYMAKTELLPFEKSNTQLYDHLIGTLEKQSFGPHPTDPPPKTEVLRSP